MTDDTTTRAAFAGGDQGYLRDRQYGDGRKLDARSRLHLEYGTAAQTLAAFEAHLVEWPSEADVLECGCGTGLFWQSGVPPTSIRLSLTDLSDGMVTRASENARSHGYDIAEATDADVQDLRFDTDSFDVVIANHMLYHVPDPDLGLAELARVLRPGGVLLAATNSYGHMDLIGDVVDEVFGSEPDGLYDVFGLDSGERRLREHFSTVSWHAYVNDLVVDDEQAVVDYVLSFPPGEDADEAQQRAVATAVGNRFADGVVRIRTRAGVFVASALS